MSRDTVDLLTPRILVVDDEIQIHASLRLRLSSDYDLVFCLNAQEALKAVVASQFDLCFVDLHMPGMTGLAFIEAAQQIDSTLGYVVLSAFDSSENLRRTISLQVFDFVAKPLPERHEFESNIPAWIDRTRRQRRERRLAKDAGAMSRDLDQARQEREVELVASETARDALLHTANLLTTIHAHLVTASYILVARAKTDSSAAQLLRNLEVTRKTADAAMMVAEGFFDSAYGSRDTSPALVDTGLNHASQIAARINRADELNKIVDPKAFDPGMSIRGLSGIEFLLLLIPAIVVALKLAKANTTVGIHVEHLSRLDGASKDPRFRSHLWINRKHALVSQAGILITIGASAPSLSRSCAEGWLKGEEGELSSVAPRGLIAGVQKSRGLLGISLAPQSEQFQIMLALPV